MPLQGVDFLGNRTRRDAAGWYVLPFQGEGLTRAFYYYYYQYVVPTGQKKEYSPRRNSYVQSR
ncbi:MAG: hypothetical protein LBG58_15225 [Planctomycetaceae bacterium]|nr:hypothetical protein [Planctomycetaceae bacterium]